MFLVRPQWDRSLSISATGPAEVTVKVDECQPTALTPSRRPLQAFCAFQKNLGAMGHRLPAVALSEHDHRLLLKWSKSRTLAARVVVRSRIVLMLARGAAVDTIANELRVAPGTIRLWSKRFRQLGPQGLLREARGRGRKPTLSQAARQTLQQEDAGSKALTVRERARQLGVSASTVSRWRRRTD